MPFLYSIGICVSNHSPWMWVSSFWIFFILSLIKPTFLSFWAFYLNFMVLGQLIHMPCILSTPGVVVTRFWSLSSLGIELFRETFVFTYFFLSGSSGLMRYQISQFAPNSGIHVAGEKKICFQTIIFEGVNFIVNNSTGTFLFSIISCLAGFF